MSFQTEIEAIVGDIDSPDYKPQATLYLVEGVKYITRIISQNIGVVERLTTVATLNNSSPTLALSTIVNVVSVYRMDADISGRERVCKRLSYQDSFDALDPNSIHYVSVTDPRYYIWNDTLHVIPTPEATQTAKVMKIQPDTSVVVTSTSVDNFPKEYERGIVLYASLRLLHLMMNAIDKPIGATNLTTMVAGDVDTVGDRIDITKWYDIVGDYIQQEDIELAQAYIAKIGSYLSSNQMELNANSSKYQWYESQFMKVSYELHNFIRNYLPQAPAPAPTQIAQGGNNEASAND